VRAPRKERSLIEVQEKVLESRSFMGTAREQAHRTLACREESVTFRALLRE
jgi:hypothetical protein